MDCKDKILSNNYYDVITDFPINLPAYEYMDLCYINIDNVYNIVYISQQDVRNFNEYIFDYKSVPKLYGLMQEESGGRGFDPNSLIVSGITQIQREPLSLTGRGVVICVIDTGDGVILLSGGAALENTGFGRLPGFTVPLRRLVCVQEGTGACAVPAALQPLVRAGGTGELVRQCEDFPVAQNRAGEGRGAGWR